MGIVLGTYLGHSDLLLLIPTTYIYIIYISI